MLTVLQKSSLYFCKENDKMKYCYPQNIKQEVINSEIDNKPSFYKYIFTQCEKKNNKKNKLVVSQEKRTLPIKFYLLSSRMTFSAKSLNKIGKIQERAVRILYNDFPSDYES